MKKSIYILFLFFSLSVFPQLKIVSWNIENLGKSKSENEIAYIANTLKDYDLVAIQEVVAGKGGAQAVAKIADVLNRKGAKWDYTISNPTTGSAYKTERYAFLWKTAKVKKIGKAWLEKKYKQEIDREPFFCTFQYNNKEITLVNFHAITKSKQPEREIKYFKYLPEEYPKLHLLFLGDFNCPQSHTVFNPLKKMGYAPVFKNQKTTLKRACKNGNCLASELDNIFYKPSLISIVNSKIIPFYKDFATLALAREISDHVPISFTLQWN
uniref:endonuclease/exonuclease/phosphatase family protein n=1 Tax=Flavobacterium sp. TaxID=239 RepID=UPI00404A71DE